jgi:SWI/SNF-related matrix-associated actin-dependent regulator 1 of chromatin subfamily A
VEYVRDVESVCIKVAAEDRLYVTEHAILTHNTNQSIGVVNCDKSIHSVVVICPLTVNLNWSREFFKFCSRPVRVKVMGTKGVIHEEGDISGAEVSVLVLHYDAIIKPAVMDAIPASFDYLIADEAHLFKNPDTKRSLAIRELAKRARKKVFLTGTPIPNRPSEIWNSLDVPQPGAWGSFIGFKIRYEGGFKVPARGRVPEHFEYTGSSNLVELQERLRRHIMVRRLKEDVLTELPAKVRQIFPLVDVEGDEDEAVTDKVDVLWELVERARLLGTAGEYIKALAKFEEGSSVGFEEASVVRHHLALRKVPASIDWIKEKLENGVDKIVVFAWHNDVIDQLAAGLAEYRPVVIYGATPQNERQPIVDRFQKDPGTRVFIGNIKAAGVGITLTAASYVVFVELDWVPGNISQAEDRCHRIGQKDVVNVYHLVVNNSMDIRFAKILVIKQDIADHALDLMAKSDFKNHLEELEANVSANQGPAAATDAVARARAEAEVSHAQAAVAVPQYTAVQKAAILTCLQVMAASDQDRVLEQNEMGYNRTDSAFGHSLSDRGENLSDRQFAAAHRMLQKYRNTQLPREAVEVLYPESVKAKKKARKNPGDAMGLHDDPLWAASWQA